MVANAIMCQALVFVQQDGTDPFAKSLALMVGTAKDVSKFVSVSKVQIVTPQLVNAPVRQVGRGRLATNHVQREDSAKTVSNFVRAKMELLATMFQGGATALLALRESSVRANAL